MATFTFRFNVTVRSEKSSSAQSTKSPEQKRNTSECHGCVRVDYFTIDRNGAVSFDDSAI